MKTQEELKALREETEALYTKRAELSDEELAQVSGGGQLPEGIYYKYKVGDLVKTKSKGFTLEITAENGWYSGFGCPQYWTVIKALPDSYVYGYKRGTWKVGDKYGAVESDMEPV